jgi:outer membrane receptor protein involved in Fe transport
MVTIGDNSKEIFLMRKTMAFCCAVSLLLTFGPVVLGQTEGSGGSTGKIIGTIIDEYNGMTLPMTPVEVVGTDTIVYSEMDGKYSLELPPGTHELKVAFPAYEEKRVQVEVVAGQVQQLDIILGLVRFKEEVTVTAEAATPELYTSEAQLLERKKAAVIADNLAREEMSRNADSDAASAMQRVTGLSVVENQYVFVRGLGERYSNTVLNGSVMPTTEPDKKVVPLDLFPTGLVESVKVEKTYMPDRPADFSGGLVAIEPTNFPESQTLNFAAKFGGNSITTGQDFGTYPGGSTDWLGFDDGTRALPGSIPDDKVVRGSILTDRGYTPDELQALGRSFSNVWEPRTKSATPNQSYNFVWGASGEKLGGVVSYTYRNGNRYQEEERNFYKVGAGDQITLQNDYDFKISTNKVNMGLVGNLAYHFNPTNRLAFENFYSHNSKNETRVFEGFNNDIRTDIRNSRLYWVEEGIFSSKVSGEHFKPSWSNSQIEWRFNWARATRDEPDLREVLYEYRPSSDRFVLADESQSGFRMFNDLNDRVYDLALDWSIFTTQWSGLPAMIKFGPALTFRERDFASRRFRFVPRNTIGIDLSLPPEQLFAPENIGPFFELKEETRTTDAYNADQNILAGYGMVDLPLAQDWRFVGGVRVERSEQNVNTFDLFNPDRVPITSTLDNTDILPGLNLIYNLADTQNLRFGYSHTVNRPEFRELAPFEFTDVVGGRAVVGNSDLKRASIRNVDVRWEWFPGSEEVVAASFFYKDFNDPIERVVQATAQLRTSYQNAMGATDKGFELEARKLLSEYFYTAVNYTFVDSNIELERGTAQVQTSLVRPLAGQSENVFNGVFEFRLPDFDFSTRLLYNFFGDRIIDVGSLGLPDIIEEGRGTVDLVFWKRWNKIVFRATFENLTDAEHLFTQGGETQRVFKMGRTFTFGFGYAVY